MIRKSVKRFSEKIMPQQQAAYMPQVRQENGLAIVKIVGVRIELAAHMTSSWPGSTRPSTSSFTVAQRRGCPAQGRA
jgi:hypothetical protein